MKIPTQQEIAALFAAAPDLPLDLQGWHYDQPIFQQMIQFVKPTTIIEVGSWKGASAAHMLQKCIAAGLDTRLFAVDFFQDTTIHSFQGSFGLFLSNMKHLGFDRQVIPVKECSMVAAFDLEEAGVVADLIYIDAGHTFDECLGDLVSYWPLLRPGGVMIGDDYHEIPSVAQAVRTFCSKKGLAHRDAGDGYHWTILKP